MPIFEYECRSCGHEFERLVRTGDQPACPACQSQDLEKLLSLPSVSTDTTRDASFQKARVAGRAVKKEQDAAYLQEVKEHMEDHAVAPTKPGPLRKRK